MTYRGFSLLELILALGLSALLMLALFSLAFSLPRALSGDALRMEALALAQVSLDEARHDADTSFQSLASSTTSDGIFSLHRLVSPAEDEAFADITSTVSWKSPFGIDQEVSLHERITNTSPLPSPCDPFVSGDWTRPARIARYALTTQDLFMGASSSLYTLGALATTPSFLVVGIASTSNRFAPTIFFLSMHERSRPTFVAAFDNASLSRTGFTNLAVAGSVVFAGNSFGSESAATCSDQGSCAQVHAFTVADTVPKPIGLLSLATTTPPYAVTVTGATAAPRTLSYHDGYLFVGLEKTAHGDEFNIVDAHNPSRLSWHSGLAIGRSVTGISVRDAYAYLATDDPHRELVVVDISDVDRPRIVASWDAAGADRFGFGAASTVRQGYIRFARTYSPNGKEFSLLDVRTPSHVSVLQEIDSGTSADPESAQALITQDWLTFLLLSRRLEFWNTGALTRLEPYGSAYALPPSAQGVSLACKNNHIYVGYTAAGESSLDVLRGS